MRYNNVEPSRLCDEIELQVPIYWFCNLSSWSVPPLQIIFMQRNSNSLDFENVLAHWCSHCSVVFMPQNVNIIVSCIITESIFVCDYIFS